MYLRIKVRHEGGCDLFNLSVTVQFRTVPLATLLSPTWAWPAHSLAFYGSGQLWVGVHDVENNLFRMRNSLI